MGNKILIVSLGRNNSLPVYAKSIYSNLDIKSFDVLLSAQSEVQYEGPNKIVINTYQTTVQFVWGTLIYLPFIFLSLIPRIYREYKTLYLPYMHFWDLPFIALFKILGRKVVLTVHDGELHKGEDGIVLKTLNYLEIKLADSLIFLTPYVQKNVISRFNITKPFYIVPHGLLGSPDVIDRSTRKIGKNLLFLGRISPYKGVGMLMDAIQHMGAVDKLIIAGKSIYKVNYIQHPKIEIRDEYLTEDEITGLLNWADVLVLPYLEASQSGVIALGINATIPMVCTNVGGLTDQLSANEAIFVEPDSNSLQQGINKLLCDEVLYHKIVDNLKHKKQSLSWQQIAAQVQGILH